MAAHYFIQFLSAVVLKHVHIHPVQALTQNQKQLTKFSERKVAYRDE